MADTDTTNYRWVPNISEGYKSSNAQNTNLFETLWEIHNVKYNVNLTSKDREKKVESITETIMTIDHNANINDHIKFILVYNGIGFNKNKDIKEILNPYFTTKKNGTGLGLSIVNKIINDHDGELEFFSISDGAKIEINFKLNGD